MDSPMMPAGVPEEVFANWMANLERDIESEVMRGCSPDEAIVRLQKRQEADFAGLPGDTLKHRLAALSAAGERYRHRLDRVEYLTRRALRAGRQIWYGGAGEEARNWHGLVERLGRQGRRTEEVTLVDEESTTILSLVDNPGLSKFSTRGLVIGHVQSGKTGNMAALLAKAADTPYRFFVVLSGMTDSLRNQTQRRLEADVVEAADEGRWHLWTRCNTARPDGAVINGDFGETDVSGFAFGHKNHLAVMKKNAGVLRRFLQKLRATPTSELEGIPFIVIDDECDQASVNAARLETAISKINELIRDILGMLPRVAYVGYTATPFANVLINPQDVEDLYPRDFIHPLRRPAAYFGAAELFGRHALEGDTDDDDENDMIRIVRDDEAGKLRPVRRGAAFIFEVSESLQAAIRYFIMATAAREVRGQGDHHSSMLVHTSVLNSVHRAAEQAISPWLARTVTALEAGDLSLIAELRAQWECESRRVEAARFGREQVTFDSIRDRLAAVARSIEVKVENWTSTDRIDYEQPSRRYLVIGGNVLARGLTLEGLVVSFFMRTSSQYDTLMQMGRWFGYRPGFEDLPRVWMEDVVRQYFFDLATVEEEIRSDADRYARDQTTPSDFAVRIKRIPGLAVTARSKMRHARVAQIGYAGTHRQTIRFRRYDREWLEGNWQAGGSLVGEGEPPLRSGANWIVRSVPVAAVRNFLSHYRMLDAGRGLVDRHLIDYIDRQREVDMSLERWTVVAIGAEGGGVSEVELGRLGKVRCVSRAPLRNSDEVACIKALMSRRDIVADLEEVSAEGSWDSLKKERERLHAPPLLLLYPIDRNSTPSQSKASIREDMNAAADLLGMGIVFPGSADKDVYIQANLQPEDAEELVDVGEDAIPQELVDDARN